MKQPWYADGYLVGYAFMAVFGFVLSAMLPYRPNVMRRFLPGLSDKFMRVWAYLNLVGAVWLAVLWVIHVITISL